MSTYLCIGATAASTAPCHSDEDWEALLAAMEAGDAAEIFRITTTAKPRYFLRASLKAVEPPTLKKAADDFWAKRGKTPKARMADASGVPVVASVRT